MINTIAANGIFTGEEIPPEARMELSADELRLFPPYPKNDLEFFIYRHGLLILLVCLIGIIVLLVVLSRKKSLSRRS